MHEISGRWVVVREECGVMVKRATTQEDAARATRMTLSEAFCEAKRLAGWHREVEEGR